MSFPVLKELVWHLEAEEDVKVGASSKRVKPEEGIFPRRPHSKSRSGCLECKRKRRKCDEVRPQCGACSFRREDCEYPREEVRSTTKRLTRMPRSTTTASLSLYQLDDVLTGGPNIRPKLLINLGESCRRNPAPHLEERSLSDMLRHFHQIAPGALRYPPTPEQLSSSAVQPYLLNASLAFAALHLQLFHPFTMKIRLAAWCFAYQAVGIFSGKIQNGFDIADRDAVVMCCEILSVLTFHTDESNASSSTIIFPKPNEANWLFVLAGFGVVMKQATLQLNHDPNLASSLNQVPTAGNSSSLSTSAGAGAVKFKQHLEEICGIRADSTAENNPYLVAVQQLVQLEAVDPHYPSELFSFPREMTPQYLALITAKDPRSLLLLSYWLEKMRKTDCWWATVRARVELQAISQYLDEVGGEKIRCLLRDFKIDIMNEEIEVHRNDL
ncbi:hypothetical protein N431DRAFT_490182 [Stipitochalara longipes BDJ]|nr:hypothetical protein N431DRAFT_490182 [Stipitochalara longipes BDJ]